MDIISCFHELDLFIERLSNLFQSYNKFPELPGWCQSVNLDEIPILVAVYIF